MLVITCAPTFAANSDTADSNALVRCYLPRYGYGVDMWGDFGLLFKYGSEEYMVPESDWDGSVYDGSTKMAIISEKHQNERFILQVELVGKIMFRPDYEVYIAREEQAIANGQAYFDFKFSEQNENNPFIYAYIPLLQPPLEREFSLINGRFDFTFDEFDLSNELKELFSTSATEKGESSPIYGNTPVNDFKIRLTIIDPETEDLLSTMLLAKLDFFADERKEALENEINSIVISHIDSEGNVTLLSSDENAPTKLGSLAGSYNVESSIRDSVRTASITLIPIVNGVWEYRYLAQLHLELISGYATGVSNQFRTSDGALMSYERLKYQEGIVNYLDGVMRLSFSFFLENDYKQEIHVERLLFVEMTAIQEPPILPPTETALFTDLGTDHWAFSEISELVGMGVLTGYPDGSFAPDNNIKRNEFAKLMVTALGLPLLIAEPPAGWYPDYRPPTQQDAIYLLDKTTWYYPYVVSAADYLEFKVIPDNWGGYYDFDAETPATRIDITAALVRALGLQNEVSDIDISVFSDHADIPEAQKNYAALAYQYGIISGYPDGTFMPMNPISRAEACYILVRVIFTLLA